MGTCTHRVAAFVITLVITCFASRAIADDFFSSKPGDLTSSHGALDDPQHCNDCHVNGTKDLANDKCLGCHDHNNLKGRIESGKGFHASALVKGKECKTCHIEHKGRSFDIMGWKNIPGGQKTFDHQLTGWRLNGKHANTDCDDCHKNHDKQGLKTFMGTDRLCGSCHLKEQPHKFEASEKDKLACERCHGESVWKPAKPLSQQRFDHDDRKDALMPLLGMHKDVACTKCHPKSVFNLPFAKPDSCGNAGCHNSPHDGHLFGKRDCEWCHSPTFKTLQRQNFDHTEKSKFDLGPAHRNIKCYDCHTKAIGEGKPSSACETCHAKDSHHQDRFSEYGSPPRCGTCHPSGGPKFTPTAFNHSRTRFKLEFKHLEVNCRGCHRGTGPAEFEDFRGLIGKDGKPDCMGCHAHKKAHADDKHPTGRYKSSQCLQCHMHPGDPTVSKNNKMTETAHGKDGSFPLVLGHAKVPCADCHTGRDKSNKTSFSALESNCNANGKCHEDSLHQGTLGANCNNCHIPGTWVKLNFNHNEPFPEDAKGEVTSFKLKGEHLKNKCIDCHTKERKFAETHATCAAEGCHQEDDAHKARLGTKCEQCHQETGDNIFNHNTMSKFHLDGKHLEVRCADCHPSITFKPRPTNCFGCHPEPKVHRGQYGTQCEQCHSTKTFEDIKPLHDVGDFSLKGMHDNIACERCHKDTRPLAGSGNFCLNCHRQDDVHNNSLSPRCGECHTQWSFAPARFDHTRVGCNLNGVHKTLACADCHKNGNFAGISPRCVSCHVYDALRANSVPPEAGMSHSQEVTCARCHNMNSWLGAPAAAALRESVCR